MIAKATSLFWLWTLVGVGGAWLIPEHFIWFAPYIGSRLGVIMLGMGLTLSFDDFQNVLEPPKAIGLGVAAQFLLMPTLGLLIAKSAVLSPGLSAGLVLVICCPGGTAMTDPMAPVPSAVSAFFRCLIGSMLAGIWRLKKDAATVK